MRINVSVSTEERSKKAIHDVFGSGYSNSANYESQREDYPDMRLVGSWNDALEKLNVDDNLNPNVAHDMEILRKYACKGNDVANTRPRVYTDEEKIEAAINYLKNRSTTTIEEPFTEVVSKTTKKNLKKDFHVHNTRSKGRLSD